MCTTTRMENSLHFTGKTRRKLRICWKKLFARRRTKRTEIRGKFLKAAKKFEQFCGKYQQEIGEIEESLFFRSV